MKKLNLNKKTISQMDRSEMEAINGGDAWTACIGSCPRGSRKTKACCDRDKPNILTFHKPDKPKEITTAPN